MRRMMRVDMPPAAVQVAVGPPEAPAPTLVRFERNVVVLRGQVDDRPDQLTCDTLRLSLVPAEKPLQPKAASLRARFSAKRNHVGPRYASHLLRGIESEPQVKASTIANRRRVLKPVKAKTRRRPPSPAPAKTTACLEI